MSCLQLVFPFWTRRLASACLELFRKTFTLFGVNGIEPKDWASHMGYMGLDDQI